MPGVPLSSCSIGVAIACETVSALAPGYEAPIFTTGGVICGYWSIGNMVRPMMPTMTINMEMTAENIGLSMKKLTFIFARFCLCSMNQGIWVPAYLVFAVSVGSVTSAAGITVGSTGFTFIPGVSLWKPSVTMFSLATKPRSTTT